MNRSWTVAAASAAAGTAALTLGLFLAVGKESLAGGDAKTIKIVSVSGDEEDDAEEAEVAAVLEAKESGRGGKGGYLGLSLREDTKNSEGGALIERVVDDSPSAKAGIKEGDVIVGFGGDIVRGPAKVTQKLRAAKPGDKVTLDVRRDGKVQKFSVELGERRAMAWRIRTGEHEPLSEEAQQDLELSLERLDEKLPEIGKRLGKMKLYAPGRHGMMVFGMNRPLLGIEMLDTTPEFRELMGGSKDAGVLVGKVLAGSAAEKAGLRVGDLVLSIDREKVSDPGELAEAVGDRAGKTVDLEIVRDKKAMHVKAVLPKIDEPEDEPTGPRASLWRMPACAPPAAPAVAPPAFRRVATLFV